MATTFVSSTFFFKTTKGFDKVTLILGISDGEQQEKFDQKLWNLQDRLLPKKKIEWWNSLDKDTREAIRKQKIKVRYGKIDVAVHSKIYLLQGKAGTRVVVGSANLTSRAFGNKTQFEELLIFDNSPLYETYKDRFNQLMQNTEDFINELSNQLPKEKTVMINTNDPEIIMKLVEDEISKMVCFSVAIISEEQLEQLRELPSAKEKEEEEAKQLLHLICFLTRKRHNKPEYELISQKKFKEKIPAVKTTLCKSNEQSTLKDNRIILLFDHRNCTLKRGDCLGEADLREKKQEYLATLQTFSAPVRLDLIKDRLMLINEFVESYSKFTIFKDPEISKRVMECILYAFSS